MRPAIFILSCLVLLGLGFVLGWDANTANRKLDVDWKAEYESCHEDLLKVTTKTPSPAAGWCSDGQIWPMRGDGMCYVADRDGRHK